MKTIDLTPLLDNDSEFAKLVGSVSEKYKCDWDDAVHDSYGSFVRDIDECSKQIHSIRCKVETLKKEEAALKVDDVISAADRLCREAESV